MNRRIVILIAVTVAAVAGAFWFMRPPHLVNLPPSASGPWVAFGDSLTAGLGASQGHSYPELLSQRLNVPIRNLGRSGDTTASAMSRMDEALALHPRVVLLGLGGNDGLQQMPREETFANLAAMIDQFQAQGAFVVLLGIRSATVFDKNNGRFKSLARRKGALLIPNILSGLLGHPDLMSDEIHPNNAGYEIMAQRIADALQPLMPRLRVSGEAAFVLPAPQFPARGTSIPRASARSISCSCSWTMIPRNVSLRAYSPMASAWRIRWR